MAFGSGPTGPAAKYEWPLAAAYGDFQTEPSSRAMIDLANLFRSVCLSVAKTVSSRFLLRAGGWPQPLSNGLKTHV